MNGPVVIAGANGFIGTNLAERFRAQGREVRTIARHSPHIRWTDTAAITAALEGSDLLINLAGKSVDCRYHARNRRAILESRTETTATLGRAVQACTRPPALWLNASTATIYRHAEDRPMTERDGEIGSGFSVDVATAWEDAFFSFDLPATRQVALRMAIVFGRGGGALKPLSNLVRFGLGGHQGNGRQMVSWIHIDDLFNMIRFICEREDLKGAINCLVSGFVDNRTLMRTLRKVLGMPIGLPSPAWLLEIGTVLIRSETELVLKSRWVLPGTLTEAGYRFAYPELEGAIREILGK